MHDCKCDIIGIPETWWDSSHDWSIGIKGFSLFRKEWLRRQRQGIALMSAASWSVWNSAWRRMQSQTRACGSRLKEGRDRGHYSGGSDTGHPATRMALMKPLIGTQEHWSSTTTISVGGTTQ